jgi:chromosome segregation protein
LQDEGTLKLHQLWFLKHRDAAKRRGAGEEGGGRRPGALDERIAELRHVEAELETVRQAHYAAGDALHAAQGSLAEAALEASRLEERIRYVVDSRQRVEQRIAELAAQDARGQQRSADAGRGAGVAIAGQIAAADEHAATLAAQAEEQAGQLPGFEDALRTAQSRSNDQRVKVSEVQQQIQLLAADSRNVEEQSRR